ncbi:TonB-dependent receptor [Algoriphagus halophytocola]|uniref:TonB-dependent receptor n=1 Tax=Algoriphagus halophytocola TaxID=2991499 RepID=A0ABY6MFM1_9BACT|nr:MULTISPECIES: TonB-dependent receptor [unclassified Algoriphagus]UZD21131.1 TonB-dependent receptor [Algoriphagus sp. TR-M5]WBL42300.1 TonB-dependent receptor [Algoriphagus sp. TR-M9]
MKPTAKILFALLLVTIQSLSAQDLTQTIRGSIVDQITNAPMPGATVMILGSDPLIGTTSDSSGEFKLEDLPVGTYTLKVSFIGFKEIILPNIKVNSGKEVVLSIPIEEDITQIQEVVVTANEKDRTINEMVQVSGRTFSVEDTRKFAAAVNDPGRMVTSFSGVTGTDDGNNNISIRGNSPNGLLWRMEGIDIPNPNHFVNPGTSGGGVSILSSQLLSNSDFLTGAFPAEYGNALSGVFDLNLRKGNNENQEFTLQAGFLGVDIAAEGPIAQGYKGSYLVNYRYSTLSLLSKIGLPLGDFVTNFQDLSFNVFLPTGPKSTITIFGFGGLSDQDGNAEKDSLAWESEGDRYGGTFFSNTGAIGAKHSYIVNAQNFLQTTLLASGNAIGTTENRLDDNLNFQDRFYENYSNSKITLSAVLNTKVSAKAALRSGFYVNQLYYNLREDDFAEETQTLQTNINSKGNTQSVQAFSQLNYRANERLTFNLGLHYIQLLLNNSNSVEPRIGTSYALDEKQRVSLGYGLHSQVQPLGTYFAEQDKNGEITLPNKNLDLSKSHHFVLGYDRSLSPHLRLKVETYYQHLFQIPIRSEADESYSIINQQWTFATDPLVNEGYGKNYGVELTLEQFTHNGLYFLLSGSLYNSLYKTNEEIWRNTAYNGNFNMTLTAGKEYEWKKNRVFGVNLRVIYSGGLRDTPFDLDASIAKGEGVYLENQAYEMKNPNYFRADLRLSLTKNKPKSTRIWALDIQNASNRKNVYGQYFEPMSNEIKTSYQAPLIPILSYRVEF